MQFPAQMLILLSCFVAVCYPELVFSTKKAKTLHKIINLHRKYLRRLRVHYRFICLTNYFKFYAETALLHSRMLKKKLKVRVEQHFNARSRHLPAFFPPLFCCFCFHSVYSVLKILRRSTPVWWGCKMADEITLL